VQNSNSSVKRSASSSNQAKPRRTMPMLDQLHPCIHNSIENIVDVKADGNCGYHAIIALLGMREDSWSLVCNHLLKELAKWSNEYINLLAGKDRFEELKWSILVDGLSMVYKLIVMFCSIKFALDKCNYNCYMQVIMDKSMNIIDMGYVIASRYNVILVSLSLQQSMTYFPLRSQPPKDSSVHHVICISHVYDNHFVQVKA